MTLGKKDFIWVLVDTLTKSDNFIPVRIDYNVVEIAKIFVKKNSEASRSMPSYHVR